MPLSMLRTKNSHLVTTSMKLNEPSSEAASVASSTQFSSSDVSWTEEDEAAVLATCRVSRRRAEEAEESEVIRAHLEEASNKCGQNIQKSTLLVAAAIHAMMNQADAEEEEEEARTLPALRNTANNGRNPTGRRAEPPTPNQAAPATPKRVSVQDISACLMMMLESTKCALPDCILVGLVYLERLVANNPEICVTTKNWRPLVAASFLLANKVWDDLSFTNIELAKCLKLSLGALNRYERCFLAGLKYDVRVSLAEFARVARVVAD